MIAKSWKVPIVFELEGFEVEHETEKKTKLKFPELLICSKYRTTEIHCNVNDLMINL